MLPNFASFPTTFASEAGIVIRGDSFDVLASLAEKYPEGVADMIFADPPYFLSNGGITCQNGKMVKVDKGQWDKSQGPAENHRFNLAWIEGCKRLLKPNGTIWISGTHHVIHSVGFALQTLEFKILNAITWEKPNPPPNLACRTFTHSTETILWAARSAKSKYRFNYAAMKEANGGKQMKDVWRFTAPSRDEKGEGKHPTQKPLAVVERCILASTIEDEVVLDPFLGSGTTALAAHKLRRRFVGIEVSEEYATLTARRLEAAKNHPEFAWNAR